MKSTQRAWEDENKLDIVNRKWPMIGITEYLSDDARHTL